MVVLMVYGRIFMGCNSRILWSEKSFFIPKNSAIRVIGVRVDRFRRALWCILRLLHELHKFW